MEPAPEVAGDTASRIDGELRLAREAILLVASGASPRVMLAGLEFGDRLADACARMAAEAGVHVSAVRSTTTGRIAFTVERNVAAATSPVVLAGPLPAPVRH